MDERSRELLQRLLLTSVKLWENQSGKDVVALAKASQIWLVRARCCPTLEKYLHPSTFPNRPNTNAIIRTARFVLSQLPQGSAEDGELRNLLEEYLQHEHLQFSSQTRGRQRASLPDPGDLGG